MPTRKFTRPGRARFAAGSRRNARPAGKPRPGPRPQLLPVLRAMQALNIARPNPRPRNRKNGNGRARDIGVQERLIQKGHEFLGVVNVPIGATIGQNLYQLEVNPTQIPRLSVIASQYKQWRGNMTLHVESLGNAFATSSVSAAFVPDPDTSELTQTGVDLLRVIDSAPSKNSLHLQDSVTKSVTAAWSLTTNPWKFIVDSDPSDRANGLFVVVALGAPGTIAIDLKISISYNVTFQGNTFLAMEPAAATVTSAWYGLNNSISDILLPAGVTGWQIAGSTLTINYPTGTVNTKYYGFWAPLAFSQFYASTASATTAAFRQSQSLMNFTITATAATLIFQNALPALVAATPYTIIVLPRASTQ